MSTVEIGDDREEAAGPYPVPVHRVSLPTLARQMGGLMTELPSSGYASITATWANPEGLLMTLSLSRTEAMEDTDDAEEG